MCPPPGVVGTDALQRPRSAPGAPRSGGERCAPAGPGSCRGSSRSTGRGGRACWLRSRPVLTVLGGRSRPEAKHRPVVTAEQGLASEGFPACGPSAGSTGPDKGLVLGAIRVARQPSLPAGGTQSLGSVCEVVKPSPAGGASATTASSRTRRPSSSSSRVTRNDGAEATMVTLSGQVAEHRRAPGAGRPPGRRRTSAPPPAEPPRPRTSFTSVADGGNASPALAMKYSPSRGLGHQPRVAGELAPSPPLPRLPPDFHRTCCRGVLARGPSPSPRCRPSPDRGRPLASASARLEARRADALGAGRRTSSRCGPARSGTRPPGAAHPRHRPVSERAEESLGAGLPPPSPRDRLRPGWLQYAGRTPASPPRGRRTGLQHPGEERLEALLVLRLDLVPWR